METLQLLKALTPSLQELKIFGIIWIVYRLLVVLYNLYFHPLAKYPGPRFAAASSWWETYIDCFTDKNMPDVLTELHAVHGAIIRVGPNELHFSRPSVYHEIYNNSVKWDKHEFLYHSDVKESSFAFLKYQDSKQRKEILNPLFSRRAISDMQWVIQTQINAFCDALQREMRRGVSIDMFMAYRCLTLDTITTFCYARSLNTIQTTGFKAPIVEAMETSLGMGIWVLHFWPLRMFLQNAPMWIMSRVSPAVKEFGLLKSLIWKQINHARENPKPLEDSQHPTIFHALLDVGKHHQTLSDMALYDEARTILFAGTDTTANALMMGTFHVLSNPHIYQKLKEELKAAWPVAEEDIPDFGTLEKLPYLTAVIKESLRFSIGVPSGLPRVVPPNGATIDGHFIPGGTVVSISSPFVNNSEEIFPNHEKFDPDRWLDSSRKGLDSWMIAFSKGPRSCIGINLAWCELYLGFANVFRRFDLKLDGTKLEDLRWRDHFLPHFYGSHLKVFIKPQSD